MNNYDILNVIQSLTRIELGILRVVYDWYNNILTSKCLDHVKVIMNDNLSYNAFVVVEKLADHYCVGIRIKSDNENIEPNRPNIKTII